MSEKEIITAVTLPNLDTAALATLGEVVANARQWLNYASGKLIDDPAEVQTALQQIDANLAYFGEVHPAVAQTVQLVIDTLGLVAAQRNDLAAKLAEIKQVHKADLREAWREGALHVFECGDCMMVAERDAEVENIANIMLESDDPEDALKEYFDEAKSRAKEAVELYQDWSANHGKPNKVLSEAEIDDLLRTEPPMLDDKTPLFLSRRDFPALEDGGRDVDLDDDDDFDPDEDQDDSED